MNTEKTTGTVTQKRLVVFGYSSLELLDWKDFVPNYRRPSVKLLYMHKTTLGEKEEERRIDQWNPL